MTTNSSIFSSKTRPVIPPIVHNADNSIMYVQNIRIIKTHKLFISYIFHVPKVSLNLLFVSQLCELGVDVHFLSHGCFVQDSQMGEILVIGHKLVDCLRSNLFVFSSKLLLQLSHPAFGMLF